MIAMMILIKTDKTTNTTCYNRPSARATPCLGRSAFDLMSLVIHLTFTKNYNAKRRL